MQGAKMATGKVVNILKSKTELTREEIEALTNQQAWEMVYSLPSKKQNYLMEVCFTGFTPSEKAALVAMAEECKIKVRTSVTKNLDYLVTGDDPGPSKLDKAESTGKAIITGKEFESKLRELKED
jgi:NAD-dependent DNA ligase